MVKCTFYYKIDTTWFKEENVELTVENFLQLLYDDYSGDTNILEAYIGDFKLDCDKLIESLKL